MLMFRNFYMKKMLNFSAKKIVRYLINLGVISKLLFLALMCYKTANPKFSKNFEIFFVIC